MILYDVTRPHWLDPEFNFGKQAPDYDYIHTKHITQHTFSFTAIEQVMHERSQVFVNHLCHLMNLSSQIDNTVCYQTQKS